MNRNLAIWIFVSLSLVSYSQGISLRSSTGFAGFGTPVDGYYFSFDVGIPITKGIEIAPTFTYFNRTRHNYFNMFWFETIDHSHSNYPPKDFGYIMAGSIKLYFIANPFKWLNNPKLNTIDFGIGAGYGLTSVSSETYNFYPNSYQLEGITSRTGNKFTFSYFKMFYNYHFRNYFLGIVIGGEEVIEPVSFFGLQFGIKVTNKKNGKK